MLTILDIEFDQILKILKKKKKGKMLRFSYMGLT